MMKSKLRWLVLTAMLSLGIGAGTRCSAELTPGNPGSGDVGLAVNSDVNNKPISRYIYGSNSSSIAHPTFVRSGGNRWTGYNWETNASNAGRDWYHHSDNYLGSGPPGNAVLTTINSTATRGQGYILTLPMAGYVAADTNGTVDETEIAPSHRWREVVPKKSTIYGAGAALTLAPDKNDGYVFTDEYVNWVEHTRNPEQDIFYSLDNEPALWGETLPQGWQSGIQFVQDPSPEGRTHPTIHPFEPTFVELRDKTIAHASAIKDVNPTALVFGGVGYGWAEFQSLQGAPDAVTSPAHPGGDQPSGELDYYEWLLHEVAVEENIQGRKLVDVIDLHWYPEAQGGGVRIIENNTAAAVVEARVQAPRSLWDPTYTETSWISQWGTWVGNPGNPGPVTLLPRLQRDVDDFNPGTKIAVTEYNYGAGGHISGGIAQADVLGIFGEYGVFAASWWHDGSSAEFTNAAFDMYVNYDGEGGVFGDISINAQTDSIASSSIYGSIDSSNPDRMVLVAINRSDRSQEAAIRITHDRVLRSAEVYQLTSANAAPVQLADITLTELNAFLYTMPAYSVTTLVLSSDGLAGDFNGNGIVDAADFTVWRDTFGATGDGLAADANYDRVVDTRDYDIWVENFGAKDSGPNRSVPEPSSMLLAEILCCGLLFRPFRRG